MLFKGTPTRIGRGHRAAGGLDRRPARRVHVEGVRRLLHQGARRAPAAGRRHPGRPRRATRCLPTTTSSERRRSSSKRSRWSRTRPTISSTRFSPRRSGTGIRSAGRFSARRRACRRSISRRSTRYFAQHLRRREFRRRRRRQPRARSRPRAGRDGALHSAPSRRCRRLR